MTRQEFLDTLGRILNRELSEQEVAENLHYYEQYIVQEMNAGRTEEQVLAELGDPRLIARTILQVDQKREETAYDSQDSVYSEEADGMYHSEQNETGRSNGEFHIRTMSGAKLILVLVLVLIILFLVLRLFFRIVMKLLPVLLVVALAVWVYREFLKK